MEPILQTRGLVFQDMVHYPELDFQPLRATFITGPSGCGKSTLLHLLNASLEPSGGRILYRGADIAGMDTVALRREVLLVRQSAFLFDVSVRENFARYHGYRGQAAPSQEEICRCLDTALSRFPLDQNCATLSGGERQRVYLAIGLSFLPRVLLLDEPTAALDAATGRALLDRLLPDCRERGVTPILVSHDQDLTREYAEDIIQLKGGRLP